MILVTGGTGLLGTHVMLELLKSGKQVRAIKRPKSDLSQVTKTFSYYTPTAAELFSKIQWVDADLNDIHSLLEAMDAVEEVYHCAAFVSFNPKKEEAVLKINIEGTSNMVDAALEKGIKKFCHVSSIAAIGKADKPITEEMYWKSSPDNSIYSISKYGAEREVWRASVEGLNVVIVNPSIIIGPANWRKSSSHMFNTAYKGLKFYTEGVTGFVDVRDVAKIMFQLMERNIFNERFILSSQNISFREFFDYACSNYNKPLPSIRTNALLGELAWRTLKIKSFFDGSKPLITKETARAAQQKSYYVNDKIKNLLNYNFIPVEESIRDTCKLFMQDVSS